MKKPTGLQKNYPIEKWFEMLKRGRKVTLCRGKDFHCMTHSMVQYLRNRAFKLKMRLKVSVCDDQFSVLIGE